MGHPQQENVKKQMFEPAELIEHLEILSYQLYANLYTIQDLDKKYSINIDELKRQHALLNDAIVLGNEEEAERLGATVSQLSEQCSLIILNKQAVAIQNDGLIEKSFSFFKQQSVLKDASRSVHQCTVCEKWVSRLREPDPTFINVTNYECRQCREKKLNDKKSVKTRNNTARLFL
ncbi:hypothetical protein PCE1_003967 [Barthelona sp. PCE]